MIRLLRLFADIFIELFIIELFITFFCFRIVLFLTLRARLSPSTIDPDRIR